MFQTNRPVIGPAFFNRSHELGHLAQAIEGLSSGSPQWIAILGPRKIGKTSLVLEAVRRTDSAKVRVVTLDIQEQGPITLQIFRRLILRMLDAAIGAELGESLERLMRSPAAFRSALQRSSAFRGLPEALRSELQEMPDGAASQDRLHDWLDLPERLAQSLGLKLVIAVDGFQELENLARRHPGLIAQMRAIWQHHEHVAYFVSGSARSVLLALISHEASPFFHHFSIMDLGPFEQRAAVELLQQAGTPDVLISQALADQAVRAIGGHPFHLQLLGETLVRDREPGEISGRDLKDALQSLLFEPHGRLALFFENEMQRLAGRSTFLFATLDALADGPATVTEVARRIQTSTGATVGYLERLKDAVTPTSDGRYQLADPTFGLWLRWKRPGEGTMVPTTVIGDEAERAVARSLAAMGFDLAYQSRASRGAFDLLATRGGVPLGIQVTHSPLPLCFTLAEWSHFEAEARRLQ